MRRVRVLILFVLLFLIQHLVLFPVGEYLSGEFAAELAKAVRAGQFIPDSFDAATAAKFSYSLFTTMLPSMLYIILYSAVGIFLRNHSMKLSYVCILLTLLVISNPSKLVSGYIDLSVFQLDQLFFYLVLVTSPFTYPLWGLVGYLSRGERYPDTRDVAN